MIEYGTIESKSKSKCTSRVPDNESNIMSDMESESKSDVKNNMSDMENESKLTSGRILKKTIIK